MSDKKNQILLFILGFCLILTNLYANNSDTSFVPDLDNNTFRHEVLKFIRSAAMHHVTSGVTLPMDNLDKKWNNHYQKTDWHPHLTVYHHGQILGQSEAHGKSLADVLVLVTEQALRSIHGYELTSAVLQEYRFKVDFEYVPFYHYAFIEYHTQGLELSGNRVVVRTLTKKSISEQIERSKGYLLRSLDPQYHGIFKFYDASLDSSNRLLRTVYSASTLYTLIKIHTLPLMPVLPTSSEGKGRDPLSKLTMHGQGESSSLSLRDDGRVLSLKPIHELTQFILSNQLLTGSHKGAFYYGYDPKTHSFLRRLVVGTTAKSIFALLALNEQEPKNALYLARAKIAGDWLLTRVEANGNVNSILVWKNDQWQSTYRQSLLYSGQVLAALARLYRITHEQRYYQGATRIADHFVQLVNQNGPLLGDDYRPANSISSSWVLMSLIDYAKINGSPRYQSIISQIAQTILQRQIISVDDIYNHGRYLDAMTASGNGWINEVIGTTFFFCLQHQASRSCQTYDDAMLRTSRWLLQNAYTPENMFIVKNPHRALGGFITNFRGSTVRTDAVCHAVNSLLMVLSANKLKQFHHEDIMLSLPERPLREILPLLRAGI